MIKIFLTLICLLVIIQIQAQTVYSGILHHTEHYFKIYPYSSSYDDGSLANILYDGNQKMLKFWNSDSSTPYTHLLAGNISSQGTISGEYLTLNKPNVVSDWNLLYQSGFYDGANTINGPEGSSWFWGLNMNHRSNSSSYRYNGQIAIRNSHLNPTMYFRSTNNDGVGTWAKVLHNNGNQAINGNLTIGLTDENSYSKLVIKGPNKPFGIDSKRDISFEFAAAGSALLRSYRGGSWDTYLQFLTTPSSGGGPITRMHISHDGNIGIGTTLSSNPNNYKLAVNGTIGAHEVVVENSSTTWADYVFEEDYPLMPLNELAAFLKKYKHLPEIPTAEEVGEKGQSLGEMNVLLLKKVEELTLYVIELEKEKEAVKNKNSSLERKVESYELQLLDLIKRIEKLETE